MSKTFGSRSEIILPDELTKIDSVFHELLEEMNLPPDSEEADTLAAGLISLYQSGIHDIRALKLMMKP
ncbi:hypothetical protein [Ensifer canadensis]